jgi:hypothetical protein
LARSTLADVLFRTSRRCAGRRRCRRDHHAFNRAIGRAICACPGYLLGACYSSGAGGGVCARCRHVCLAARISLRGESRVITSESFQSHLRPLRQRCSGKRRVGGCFSIGRALKNINRSYVGWKAPGGFLLHRGICNLSSVLLFLTRFASIRLNRFRRDAAYAAGFLRSIEVFTTHNFFAFFAHFAGQRRLDDGHNFIVTIVAFTVTVDEDSLAFLRKRFRDHA